MAQITDKGRPGVFFTFAELATSRLSDIEGTVVLIASNYVAPVLVNQTYVFTSARQARDTMTVAKADAVVQAFNGGASQVIVRTVPATPVAADYTAALAALATQRFQVIALDHEVADSVVATFKTWLSDERTLNDRYVFFVTGGNAARDAKPDMGIAAAIANKDDFIVQAINAPKFGSVTRSSGLNAPSLAGQIAGSNLGDSFTYTEILDATDVNVALSPADVKAALVAGAFVYEFNGDFVRTVRGITTSGAKLRKSLLKQTIVRDVKQEIENNWIGKKANGPAQRLSLKGTLETYVQTLVNAGVIAEGFTVGVTRPEGADADQVAVEMMLVFQDTMEEVYVSVGFTN
ncbi:hypothetical protein BLD48_05750 [Exiguobacterium sp. KRL4]|uniref:phage tail sheath subtilisin-like domain-containing protein n=1 Tax=Exiguobacterium sp. KRL4 TaxID=1914536 RepID=UPI0008F902AB|nr:phage tail sheath subtilisin-like domain-containing protein [Exiguobacterium sp. KRL4]OIN67394.1 hypothetical protein BLD48_05750 [Exiguobacterium sp. KRL4]